MKHTDRKSWLLLATLLAVGWAAPARALVDVATWKRPPAVVLSPRYENLRANRQATGEGDASCASGGDVRQDSTTLGALIILPWTEWFLAGLQGDYQDANLRWPDRRASLALKQRWVRAAVGIMVSPDDMIMIQAGGGSFTGGSRPSSEGWNSMGLIYWLHAYSDHFSLAAGVAAMEDMKGLGPVPLLGFAWQPNEDFRVDGMLPGFSLLTWHFARPAFLWGRTEANANLYHARQRLSERPTQAQPEADDEAERSANFDLYWREFDVSAGLGIQITEQLSWEGGAGAAVARRIEIDPADGQKVESDADPAWFVRTQIGARF